ncbi:MAG: FmdE family protein [Candidatus Hecatellaceae archaeon]
MRERGREPLREIADKIRDFHGHFGPFAALGVRLGWAGMERLGARRGDEEFRVSLSLNVMKPPTTCIIDGIQVSTGCTIGNGRLKVKPGKSVAASFKLKGKPAVRFKVSSRFIKWMRDRLREGEPLEKVAYDVLAEESRRIFTK